MKLQVVTQARAFACAFVFLVAQIAWAAPSHAQIVALGASNVQGFGVSSGEAWPEQLQAMLRAKGRQYTVSNQGVYGDTTAGMLSRLDNAVPEGTRIVVLMVGGNDIRKGGNWDDVHQRAKEIVARLQARKIRVINAMPLLKAAKGRGLLGPDGIHLNPAGHRYVASALLPMIN